MLLLVLVIGDKRETGKIGETGDIWNGLKCRVRQFDSDREWISLFTGDSIFNRCQNENAGARKNDKKVHRKPKLSMMG